MIPTIITDTTITVIDAGIPKTIDSSHPNFTLVRDRLRDGLFDGIGELFTIIKAVKSFCGGKIEIDEDTGSLTFNGQEVHGSIVDRILSMMKEGFDVQPLVRFLENLMQNPSFRAVNELYGFLEYGKMPITEDGCFLAYKRVRADYKSVHDGKTDNSIGTIVEMPRNQVNENSHETCSNGLHFCSHEYLKSFSGDKVVILKVNPRDVVSIPTDYNNTKGRACRYEVVGELTEEQVKDALSNIPAWDSSVIGDYDDRDFDEYDDEEFDDYNDADDGRIPSRNVDDFIDGYRSGYLHGRRGATPLNFSGNHVDNRADELQRGYNVGYKDGKGHKRRQY